MSQAADLEAIYEMFNRVTPVTPAATKIRDAFVPWYKNLSWYDRNVDGSVYNEARTRRNAFNLANVRSAAEREAVKQVIATGLTTEELSGQVMPLTSTEKRKILSSPIASGRATIRLGSQGPAVLEWQGVLGTTRDGKFGALTKAATIDYQKAHGLVPDGVVGPATWATVPTAKNMVDSASRPLPNKEQIKAAMSPAPMPTLGGGVKNPRAAKPGIFTKRKVGKVRRGTTTVERPQPKPATVPRTSTASKAARQAAKQTEPAEKKSTALQAVKVRTVADSFRDMPMWGKLAGVAGVLAIGSAAAIATQDKGGKF